MKNSTIKLALFLSIISFTAFAQSDLTTTSDKARKHFEKAKMYYESKNDEKAGDELLIAIDADPNFIEAHMMLANIYTDKHNNEKAITHYRKAIEINMDFYPLNLYFLAKTEMDIAQYQEALDHLSDFLTYPPAKGKRKVTPAHLTEAKELKTACEFAINAVKHPVPYKPLSISDSINTASGEYFPTLTADEQTIYFTKLDIRKREEDLYYSKRIKGRWQPAIPVGPPINTDDNEGALCISTDGKYLFYTACGRDGGLGECDIYMSEKVGGQWTEPENLGAPVNSPFWESQPSFSSDGKTLYFVSTRGGGFGAADIWKSTRRNDGSWTEPVNLGATINTIKNDFSPFIHPDDQTLYFTSQGHVGMGGMDIFISRLEEGKWGKPTNVGYPINTSSDERSFTVSASGQRAYISSDRLKGRGEQDIFCFDLYTEVQPEPVTYLKGRVTDARSKQKLGGAKFELIDLASGKTIVESTSDKGSGEFLVCVPSGHEYALNVSRQGYLFYSDNIVVKSTNTKYEPFLADVIMYPLKAGEFMILKNIFFPSGAFELKQESSIELKKLANFLKANGTAKVEIGGHTDNVGDKTKNKTLSEKRAKSVYDFLVSAGVDAPRLTFKGYGDTKPVADNTTESGRAQNRRFEVTVVQ